MTFLSDILTATLKFGNFKGKESTGNISLSDFQICNISFGSVYDHDDFGSHALDKIKGRAASAMLRHDIHIDKLLSNNIIANTVIISMTKDLIIFS